MIIKKISNHPRTEAPSTVISTLSLFRSGISKIFRNL